MRDQIANAATTLDWLLTYTASDGPCPVTSEEAQEMWVAASDLHGFAAVRAFLEVCKTIKNEGEG